MTQDETMRSHSQSEPQARGPEVQTAHHVRLDESGRWGPSMEVVLTKVT
jgi:hypothetical protein